MKRISTAFAVVLVVAALELGGLPPARATLAASHAAVATSTAPLQSSSVLRREVLGFVNYYNLADPNVGYHTWNFSILSTVVYFDLQVNSGDGWLVQSGNAWAMYHSSTMTSFVNTAHASGTKVLVSLNLHDF